jgi:hypothetical protein
MSAIADILSPSQGVATCTALPQQGEPQMTTTAHYQAMIRDGVLDLYGTGVSDLTPLAGLTGLHTLHLSRTDVSDLAPLAALTGLQSLYLYGTGVSDLTPLAGLTGLHTLHLSDTSVSDASVAELRRSLPDLTTYR